MSFTKKYNQDFFIKNNQIVLSEEYLNKNKAYFKKITGSRFAAILNESDFTSPVKTWAMMVNIYYEPMDEMFANAGNIIEPRVRDWVCEKTNMNFKQYNPKEIGFDVFKDNKIFGGIPDGEPINEQGQLQYPNQPILEIKTTSIDSFVFKKEKNLFVLQKNPDGSPKVKNVGEKRLKWFNSNHEIVVPKEYMFQLGLYCYLRNTTYGLFAICFLKTDDYTNPQSCDVNNREIHLVDFNIDLNEFKQQIKYAQDWYDKFIKTGKSPKLSEEDLKWFYTEVE